MRACITQECVLTSSVIQDRDFLSHQGFPEDAHGGQFLCDKLLSLRVFNMPGRLYLGTDMLSRGNLASGEWTLYPHIWSIFGRAELDPFTSEDSSHCPSYFSMQRDALVHDWPSAHLYAFPPDCLAASGHQAGQGSQMLSPPGGSTLEEPDMIQQPNGSYH